jgi:hypothetical protein
MIKHNAEGCGAFFLYTPESMLSILNDQFFTDLFTWQVPLVKYWSRSYALKAEFLPKYAFYAKHFPELKFRDKIHGYETLKHDLAKEGINIHKREPIAAHIRKSLKKMHWQGLVQQLKP